MNTKNKYEKKCNLFTGEFNGTLEDLCKKIFEIPNLHLFWCEPENQAKRIEGFYGLYEFPVETLSEKVKLQEAKFFFNPGLVYLLKKGPKTTCALWHEMPESDNKDSEKCTTLLKKLLFGTEEAKGKESKLLCHDQEFLLRKSKNSVISRGLGESNISKKKVTAFRYFENGNLRWWRLI
ncbi:MAG: hypothetical protein HQM08_28805 [Candidatus Riflebacteria bacterium]|nr:hypothetical protein [Candidatus Riflebacteria bacterium]